MIPLPPLRFSSDPTVFSLDTPEITGGEAINTLPIVSASSQTAAPQPTTNVQPASTPPSTTTAIPVSGSPGKNGGSKQVSSVGGLASGVTTMAAISGLILTLISRLE